MARENEGHLKIAGPYVEAVLDLAIEQGVLEQTIQEMGQIAGLIEQFPDFQKLLESVVIDPEDRGRSLERIFTGRVSELTYRLVMVLNQRGRAGFLGTIARVFGSAGWERLGRIEAEVTSAVPLDKDLQRALAGAIAEDPAQVIFRARVDDSIMGGIRVRVGDQQFDATVQGLLSRLSDQLILRGHYEIQNGRDFLGH